MTDSNLTSLVFVLDRSGSMRELGKSVEAEKGVQMMVDEQRKLPGRLEVTVARFDSEYELVAQAVDADHLNASMLKIEPRGMTALRDAIGRTIRAVGTNLAARSENTRPGRVIFVIATDGFENSSMEYSSQSLKNMIEEQTNKYSWDFIFMGTSQEAVLQAQSYGINPSTSYFTSNTGTGISSAYAGASSSVTRARTFDSRVEVDDEDRQKLK